MQGRRRDTRERFIRNTLMDLAGLREALRRQPFEPFSIRLADGRSLPVAHPEFVAVAPHRLIVVAEDSSWSVVEPPLIVSLDYNGEADGKGDRKRKKKKRRRK